MPLHLRPVGPLPAEVYWRRRGVLAAVLLLLLVLLTRCAGNDAASRPDALAQAGRPTTPAPTAPPASPDPSPTVDPSATASPTADATASPTADATTTCPDGVLRVSATPARGRYAAGSQPVLRLAVRNSGTTPCTRALGRGAVELLVYSGADRIWSSDDCAPGGALDPQVLQPQELRVIALTWAGRRSRPGCAGAAEAIASGTYRVLGRVGSLRTGPSSFVVV